MIKGVGNLGSKQLIEKNFFQMRPSRRAIMTTAECQELSSGLPLNMGKTTKKLKKKQKINNFESINTVKQKSCSRGF